MTAPLHALLVCAALALAAQDGAGRAVEAGRSVALTPTPSGHLAAAARVNGQDPPVAFILDTGASHTAIAEGLAIELGYAPRSAIATCSR